MGKFAIWLKYLYLFLFRLAVYDGLRHLGPVTGGIRSCGIIACVTSNRETCADRSPSLKPISFDSIKIYSTVPANDDTFYFPSSLQTSITPISNILYCNENLNIREAKIEMETILDEDNLLAFGFYGRVYSRDFLVRHNYGKLSGDDWMKIFIGAAGATTVACVIFIFIAQNTDLKHKIA